MKINSNINENRLLGLFAFAFSLRYAFPVRISSITWSTITNRALHAHSLAWSLNAQIFVASSRLTRIVAHKFGEHFIRVLAWTKCCSGNKKKMIKHRNSGKIV